MFFDKSKKNEPFDIILGYMQGSEIVWYPQENWDKLLNKIDNIKWY